MLSQPSPATAQGERKNKIKNGERRQRANVKNKNIVQRENSVPPSRTVNISDKGEVQACAR